MEGSKDTVTSYVQRKLGKIADSFVLNSKMRLRSSLNLREAFYVVFEFLSEDFVLL